MTLLNKVMADDIAAAFNKRDDCYAVVFSNGVLFSWNPLNEDTDHTFIYGIIFRPLCTYKEIYHNYDKFERVHDAIRLEIFHSGGSERSNITLVKEVRNYLHKHGFERTVLS